jgi:hypothetical protein
MTGVAHLVWGPLGVSPLRRFLRSYRDHPAGVEHELAIVFNGVEGTRGVPADLRERLLAELDGTPHRLISIPRPVLDLAAYAVAARELAHGRVCFLNSYSVILCDGWLARLSSALDRPDVALAGASGSWESQAEWARGKLRYRPYQLLRLRRDRRDFPRFPNPHIRTTAFICAREDLLAMGLDRVVDKRDAYRLESGYDSITRQALAAGRAVVVDRSGRLYDVDMWPDSHTFRGGSQEGLLVADNRTEEWRRCPPRLRRVLAKDAWGERALDRQAL